LADTAFYFSYKKYIPPLPNPKNFRSPKNPQSKPIKIPSSQDVEQKKKSTLWVLFLGKAI
jgi:hypothetical protein